MTGSWSVNLKTSVSVPKHPPGGKFETGGSLHIDDAPRKVLFHIPSNVLITSYSVLEEKLGSLGWERFYDDPDFVQFREESSVDIISLPKDFSNFQSIHMDDIVKKNHGEFEVKDL